ncbi:UNVERIFIED_CONTAM: chromate transporter [Acetivibrio alkalicellulosi]
MIYLILTYVFFKIGLFSFGGGYAMIPLMQAEMEYFGWMSSTEFADIVSVSQMTPGPIATNTATYVGAKVAGLLGATSATLGVSLPSFVITLIIAPFFDKFKESKIVKWILKGIRPVTIGMIFSAVIFFAQTSILKVQYEKLFDFLTILFEDFSKILQIDIPSIMIFILIFILSLKFKLNPILAVFISALIGIFVF